MNTERQESQSSHALAAAIERARKQPDINSSDRDAAEDLWDDGNVWLGDWGKNETDDK